MSARAHVIRTGRLDIPADILQRHGLAQGGDVIIDDSTGSIVIRPLPDVVAQARQRSRALLERRPAATVDDFLAARRREASME